MSRIDELIAELCPDGVVFRPIWQLTTWDKKFNAVERFKQPEVRKYRYLLANEMTPFVVEGGDVKLLTTNDSNLWTTEAVVGGPIHEGEIIAIPWGGNAIVQYFNGRFVTSDNRIAVANDPNELSMKFLYYFIQSNLGTLASFYRGSGIKHPSMAKVLDWRIPVPPLEVQREIVRILDQFTQLEAELEAELEARRRQYSYYRDELLISSVDAQRTPLGEIADFRYGFTASAQDSGDCRFIRITDISPWGKLNPAGAKYVESSVASDEYLVERGDLLMARTGATYGKTMIVESDEPAVYASFLIRIRPDPEVLNPSFYWHFAQSTLYWDQVNAMVSTGGQPQFNANVLKLVKVPLPSLDEQQRVVAVLDRFDALVNDLSVGLPAELAARRKQYEYYRDKLLTFKELAA